MPLFVNIFGREESMQDFRKTLGSLVLGAALAVGFATVFNASPVAYAQAISGEITGTVTDSAGAVVPAATVVATNVATGVVYRSESNSVGEYRIPNVPAGIYDITGSAQGFG